MKTECFYKQLHNVIALNYSRWGAKIYNRNECFPLSVAQGNECCGDDTNANMQLYKYEDKTDWVIHKHTTVYVCI